MTPAHPYREQAQNTEACGGLEGRRDVLESPASDRTRLAFAFLDVPVGRQDVRQRTTDTASACTTCILFFFFLKSTQRTSHGVAQNRKQGHSEKQRRCATTDQNRPMRKQSHRWKAPSPVRNKARGRCLPADTREARFQIGSPQDHAGHAARCELLLAVDSSMLSFPVGAPAGSFIRPGPANQRREVRGSRADWLIGWVGWKLSSQRGCACSGKEGDAEIGELVARQDNGGRTGRLGRILVL